MLTSLLCAQSFKFDCESGNRGIEQGNCWEFGSMSFEKSSTNVISGSYSLRSNTLTTLNNANTWYKTPWLNLGNGNITFDAKLDNSSGTIKRIIVSYIAYNQKSTDKSMESEPIDFYTYDFVKTTKGFSTDVQKISIKLPTEIANSSNPHKIKISFVGSDGNNKAYTDNLVIPAVYNSNPANNCLPKSTIEDTDKDGVADSEDRYPEDANKTYNNYYPSDVTYGSLAFEDLWPSMGDYDLNDIVVDYRLNRITNAKNEVVELQCTFVLKASGAGTPNAFGFQLDGITNEEVSGIKGNKINSSNTLFKFNDNGLEAGQKYANCIVFDNFFAVMLHPKSGSGINVDPNAEYVTPAEINIVIPMLKKRPISEFPETLFNFYIVSDISKKDRGREIHLPDYEPTSLINLKLLNTHDDTSGPGRYYKTENNLPWAINVVQGFDYPIEKVSVENGYNNFIKWAENKGQAYKNWYDESDGNRNTKNIYKKK